MGVIIVFLYLTFTYLNLQTTANMICKLPKETQTKTKETGPIRN